MINRNIFTDKPNTLETILDYTLAAVLSICLTMGALAYFDVLVK